MKAIVVGGGIAGPATALALHRAGIEAVVLERRTREEMAAGSWLTLAPNGLSALDALEVLPLARTLGMPTRRHRMVDARGRLLGEIPTGRPLDDGTPSLTMRRSAMALALAAEAERRGIQVRYGARVTDVGDERTSASVGLADGQRLAADLVVGADGVRSPVRRAIDPAAPGARYVGLANFGGFTRAPAEATGLPREAWHFVFGRQAFFGAHRTPDDDVVWFANVPRAPISDTERAGTPDERWKARLVDLFSGDVGPAAALVAAGELELAGDSTYDLPHVPRWHRGRLVVVGDAAHAPSPSSGQGAAMALEDAVALALALRDGADIERSFAAYDRGRRRRVEKVVAAGARSSSSKTPGPVGRVFRDAALRLVFRYAVTERSTAWLTDPRTVWTEPAGAVR